MYIDMTVCVCLMSCSAPPLFVVRVTTYTMSFPISSAICRTHKEPCLGRNSGTLPSRWSHLFCIQSVLIRSSSLPPSLPPPLSPPLLPSLPPSPFSPPSLPPSLPSSLPLPPPSLPDIFSPSYKRTGSVRVLWRSYVTDSEPPGTGVLVYGSMKI